MHMEVADCLTAILPLVHHDPIAGREAFNSSHLPYHLEQLIPERIITRQVFNTRDVTPRRHQHMRRRLWMYVAKRNYVRALRHPLGRDPAGRNRAKDTLLTAHG